MPLVHSRCNLLGVRASSGTSQSFLAELLQQMPFAVWAIQVYRGSNSIADFEAACHAHELPLYVLLPCSLKPKGILSERRGLIGRSSTNATMGSWRPQPGNRGSGSGSMGTIIADRTRPRDTRPLQPTRQPGRAPRCPRRLEPVQVVAQGKE